MQLQCRLNKLYKLKMKDIFRQIFNDHHDDSQKKRNKRAFIEESYHLHNKRKYDSPKKNTQLPPEINFSELPQEQLQKDVCHKNKASIRESIRKSNKIQQFKLPSLTKRKSNEHVINKLKAVVWAIRFIHRLNNKIMDPIIKRRRQTQKYYKYLGIHITKIMQGYYQKFLQKELVTYMHILEKSLDLDSMHYQKEIIQMLYDIALKLSTSTVTKNIMQFLINISTDKSFPPSNYLSAMEIIRLDFSQKYGCIVEVSKDQTKMIIGLALGIKIFCFYVFYQPWKLKIASQKVISHSKQIKNMVFKIGSVFYFMIAEDFCFNLKEIRIISKEFLSRCDLKPIAKLDPYGENGPELSLKQLIINQERYFLNELTEKYPEIMKSIRQNVNKWINRISYICLKQSEVLSKDPEKLTTRSPSIEQSHVRIIRQKSNPVRKTHKNLEQNISSYMSRDIGKSLHLPSFKNTIE